MQSKANLRPDYCKKVVIMKKHISLIIIVSSCADAIQIEDCVINEPYGFFSGLWHGIISPFSFILSLFDSDISIYGINNNGGWYDFGFVIGAGILSFSGGKAAN